ncbi:MAG TPA: endonuclease/exonuclease/phosphatase family protein, partial [Candidatus Limnocylindria bacterium]|nr:endonuclease/exonuclease/phosphatase family protein [Candidatus Limnocylindria bacterium]
MELNLKVAFDEIVKNNFKLKVATTFLPKPEGCIRVATFNIHFGKNLTAVAEALKNNRNLALCDIILIQEIEDRFDEVSSRALGLAKLLGMEVVYMPGRRLPMNLGTHGNAILTRLPLLETKAIKLKVYKLLQLRPRVAMATTVLVAGKKVRIFNVHLNGSLNYEKRVLQLDEVFKQILVNGGEEPTILAGDFNTIPLLTLAGTVVPIFYKNQKKKFDLFLKNKGFDINCQKAGHTMKRGLLRWKLDGIYPKNAKVEQFGVERSIKVSDHFPLWAD